MEKNEQYILYRKVKWALVLIICNIYCLPLYAQKVSNGIVFCHDKQQRLAACEIDNYYVLKFDKSALISVCTKDSSVFYDVANKLFRFNTQYNNVITAQLQANGIIAIYDKKGNRVYKRPYNCEGSNCDMNATFINTFNIDSSYVSYSFADSVLQHIFMGDMKIDSINIKIYKSKINGNYSWDVSLSPPPLDSNTIGQSIKILTDKEIAEPKYIEICDKIRMQIYDKDPGIEIISNPKKINSFNLIRTTKLTANKQFYLYRTEIEYKKNGKVKYSFDPIIQCE